MTMASSVVLTRHQDPAVVIDGVPFPFAVGADVDIEPGGSDALTVVVLRVFVHGTVLYTDGKQRQVIDRELGDVGQWARDLVRAGLLERLPWLEAS